MLGFSLNKFGDVNDETSFPLKLLLIDRQFLRLRNVSANNLSAVINLSNKQILKIIQSNKFLGRLLYFDQ